MMKQKKGNSKIAIFSDLHIGIHSNAVEWYNIALDWANWFKKELLAQGIQDVVMCGDWHHSRSEISVATLDISAKILDLLAEQFNIYIITGNHDAYFKNTSQVNSLCVYKNRQNITIIDNITGYNWNDRVFTFCPWGTTIDSIKQYHKKHDIQQADVIFGHFEIETFKMNTYTECKDGFKIKDLLIHGKNIITGHFHTRTEKVFDRGSILYVGNPFEMDFGDSENKKGYYIFDTDTLRYTFFENTITPKYKKLYLGELIQKNINDQWISDSVTNNFVKIKIDKDISQEDTDVLLLFLSKFKPRSINPDYDINFNRLIDTNTEKDLSGIDIPQAIHEFIQLLDIDNKREVADYTIDLYKKCIKQ